MKPLAFLILFAAACGSEGLPAGGVASCGVLDEATCKSRSDCRADYCVHCDALAPVFTACNPTDAPRPNCPLPKCAATCSQLNDVESCNARSSCHAVLSDPGTCDCAAPGCCMQFDFCADGPADCTGPVLCRAAPPDCGPGYAISYTTDCYEGCVLRSECM